MPGIGDERYKHLRGRLVTPYRYDPVTASGTSRRRTCFGRATCIASSGMASSAIDLVRFAHALDTDEILSADAHAEMTRPAVSTDGHMLPYGVGWFVQKHDGEKLVWHYGYGAADSALLVRVPRRSLTLVALANSDQMSACSLLGDGDVLTSPVAVSFVKHFVSPENAPLRVSRLRRGDRVGGTSTWTSCARAALRRSTMTRSSRRLWPVTTSAGETRERSRRLRTCCGGCFANSRSG